MNIQKETSSVTYQIKRYEPGKIQINDEIYTHSVIIRPHQLITSWRPQKIEELCFADLEAILLDPPAIMLLGTGSKILIPPQSLLTPLFEKGIGVEFMDSQAACYTYTILTNDERDVAACILLSL